MSGARQESRLAGTAAPGSMEHRIVPDAPEWEPFAAHVEGCTDCLARTDGSACDTGTLLRRAARRATRGQA